MTPMMFALEVVVIFLHSWAACRAVRLYRRGETYRVRGGFISYCHRDASRWALWGMILCGGYAMADILWILSGDYDGFKVPAHLSLVFIALEGFVAVMTMEILRAANGRLTRSMRDQCQTCREWLDATI